MVVVYILVSVNLPEKLLSHWSPTCIIPYNAEILLYKPWGPKGYFLFEIIINILVNAFDPFEYLCYESAAIINMFTLTVRGSTSDVKI